MNKARVLFFATLKAAVGLPAVEVEFPAGMQVGDFKRMLGERFPPLQAHLGSALAAVNREYVLDEQIVPDGAEVALFPPVSGGELPTLIAISTEPIDLDVLTAEVTLPTTGAVCAFVGTVRGVTRPSALDGAGKADSAWDTAYLEYEAYQPMAEAKMAQIAAEIRRRWTEVQGIALVQRVGRMLPGTPTVAIVCSAAHRDEGVFEAARYGIDRLKEIVPVWKKEVGPQGETWVEGDYRPRPGE